MKVLGISGSPRRGENTERLVKEVLSSISLETEFISLAGKRIGPCISCLGCIEDNVCNLKDDMTELRQKIVEADAYVIGAANYYSMINGLAHCFMERFYQFRHQEAKFVSGKLAVGIGVGGRNGDPVVENLKTFFQYNQIECVGTLSAQGVANCFICGYGETCKVGAVYTFFGPGTKINQETIPSLDKQPDKLEEARKLGIELEKRLRQSGEAC